MNTTMTWLFNVLVRNRTRFEYTWTQVSLIIAVYLVFVLNAISLWRNTSWHSMVSVLVALCAMIGLTAGVFVLLRLSNLFGLIFYKLFASFVLLSSAAASFYMVMHNVVIGYGVIASVLTTDTDLHGEQFGWRFVLWMLVFGVLPVLWLWRVRVLSTKTMRQRVQNWGVSLVIAIVCALGAFKYMDFIERKAAIATNTFAPSPSGRIAHSYVPSNWLTAVGLFAYEKSYAQNTTLFDPATAFQYQLPDLSDTYVVFIIGETTRSDHMGIFGYERDTTPKLQRESNLIALRAVSCDTATKLSLNCMFVRPQGVSDNEQRTVHEKNVFSVLRSLGLSSELFALQSEAWFYRSTQPNNFMIREMITAQLQNTGQRIDDSVFVPLIKQSIEQHPKGKHLVILHTKGSHYLYSERYPESFARFKPECKSADGQCSLASLINAYDNSVLYIDTVLTDIFGELRDKKAIVFYSSDHGESLSENMHFHATPRARAPSEQFRVPFMVWMSDSYIHANVANEQAFAQLKNLQSQKIIVSHQNIYDSVLGCLGVKSAQEEALNLQNNLCSPKWQANSVLNINQRIYSN